MIYDYPGDYLYIGSETPYIGTVTLPPPPTTTLFMPPSITSVDFTPGAESVMPEITTSWVVMPTMITTDRTNPQISDDYESLFEPLDDDYADEEVIPAKLPTPTSRKLMLD